MTALGSERGLRSNLQKVQNPPNPFCNARDERGSEPCSPGEQQGRDALPSSASVATWSTRPRRSDQKALRGGGAGGRDPRPPPAWQPRPAAGRVRKRGPHGHPGERCVCGAAPHREPPALPRDKEKQTRAAPSTPTGPRRRGSGRAVRSGAARTGGAGRTLLGRPRCLCPGPARSASRRRPGSPAAAPGRR